MFYPILVPILELLPHTWTSPWLQSVPPNPSESHLVNKNRIAQIWKIWKIGHQPFEEAGSDTFVLATPNGNMLWTCDNAVIHQLFTLHPKVEQPIELVKFYDLWGPTISSVSGEEWKAHRRAVSAGFGNAMNKIVWEEAQHQTETLAAHWIAKENSVIPVIRSWTSTLALHVILSGFFGKRLEWDNYGTSTALPSGHRLTFDKALSTMLGRLATVFMTPRALLGKLPGKMFKEANESFTEVTKYFQELRAGAAENIEELVGKRNKTILGTYDHFSWEIGELIIHRSDRDLSSRPRDNWQETPSRGECTGQYLLHSTRWARNFGKHHGFHLCATRALPGVSATNSRRTG